MGLVDNDIFSQRMSLDEVKRKQSQVSIIKKTLDDCTKKDGFALLSIVQKKLQSKKLEDCKDKKTLHTVLTNIAKDSGFSILTLGAEIEILINKKVKTVSIKDTTVYL
jgi:hypothetical protein